MGDIVSALEHIRSDNDAWPQIKKAMIQQAERYIQRKAQRDVQTEMAGLFYDKSKVHEIHWNKLASNKDLLNQRRLTLIQYSVLAFSKDHKI